MNIDRKLIPEGSRVLCACSGGTDSVCLLHLLHGLGDVELFAAHLDHGLRGEESLRDAEFVRELCEKWDIPCVVEHTDAGAWAERNAMGIEEAARELRYAFLERTAERLGCDFIATAHNADDNAETLLLNLCRGTGTAGLGGISPVRGRIVRPLLPYTRAEIAAYLEERGLPHVEDSSNRNDAFRRNYLRHRVLPLLRELNPRFVETAGRTAALLRQDEECLVQLAEDYLHAELDGNSLSLEGLLSLHPAVFARVLRRLSDRSLSQKQVEDARRFCGGEGLAFLELPGLPLRREQGRLFYGRAEERRIPSRAVPIGQRLEIPEAGVALFAELIPYQGEVYDLFKTFLFKYESICGTLYCTGRRPGDRFHPQGRGCGKSLHDLFRDAGLTQEERDCVPVLRDDRGVLAVVGYPADERVKVLPGDLTLRIQISKL